MGTERYHKAARDGYLEALKEGTRRELNARDEDGMTPTLWAAFEGQLEALRLIVGRGGDPDKCDNYGNSALHFASARGHMTCVTFLVNFGVNMWALDIDFHTPKDLAAINNRDPILRFLDAALSKAEIKDPKKVKGLQEKAEKEAEKRVKEFDKLQKKVSKTQEEESRKLAKQREKMERDGGTISQSGTTPTPTIRPVLPFLTLRSKVPPPTTTPKFSDIVSSSSTSSGSAGGTLVSRLPIHFTGVNKKVQQKKATNNVSSTEFRVGDVENGGKRTVRNLSGLRSDNSSVLYVPKDDETGPGRRGRIDGLFLDAENDRLSSMSIGSGTLGRSMSQPEYLNQDASKKELDNSRRPNSTSDDDQPPINMTSIFQRPGFGSVAFRSSLSSTFSKYQNEKPRGIPNFQQSLNQIPSDAEEEEEDEDDDEPEREEGDRDFSPVHSFLAAAGILNYAPVFLEEKIDLDALMLVTEEDLTSLGIPLGPRRKLLNAIQTRRGSLESPGDLVDTRL